MNIYDILNLALATNIPQILARDYADGNKCKNPSTRWEGGQYLNSNNMFKLKKCVFL